MHVPAQLRGPLWVRFVVLVCGLLVFAAGIVALLESDLGLSPWDVLHQGLADQTPLSFGAANVVVSGVVLGLAWALGARIGSARSRTRSLSGGCRLFANLPALCRRRLPETAEGDLIGAWQLPRLRPRPLAGRPSLLKEAIWMIAVGVDVHKQSLTAVAVDEVGRPLAARAGSRRNERPAADQRVGV